MSSPGGEHISLDICVSQVGEQISLGICVSQVGEHISPGICVSQLGEQISLGMYKVAKIAIFGPKPWVNPYGKMSIFRLLELLVFIN